MPRAKLTAAAVERIKPPATGRVERFDSMLPGFAPRVTEKGGKSWVLFIRLHGRQRRRISTPTWPEKRPAFDIWAQQVENLVRPASNKVVPLRGQA
jgi:hypothetical protein